MMPYRFETSTPSTTLGFKASKSCTHSTGLSTHSTPSTPLSTGGNKVILHCYPLSLPQQRRVSPQILPIGDGVSESSKVSKLNEISLFPSTPLIHKLSKGSTRRSQIIRSGHFLRAIMSSLAISATGRHPMLCSIRLKEHFPCPLRQSACDLFKVMPNFARHLQYLCHSVLHCTPEMGFASHWNDCTMPGHGTMVDFN
jgi:hypothetical protein